MQMFCSKTWLFASLFIFFIAETALGDSGRPSVVGCRTFSQGRDLGLPAKLKPAPSIERNLVDKLSYFQSAGLSALAPTGWKCAGGIGDSGEWLVISPGLEVSAGSSQVAMEGDGIYVEKIYAESRAGEINIAKISARLFPENKEFIDNAIDNNDFDERDIYSHYFSKDKIHRLSKDVVEFESAGNEEGEGTQGFLNKNKSAIFGASILEVQNGGNVVSIKIRKAGEEYTFFSPIIKEFESRSSSEFTHSDDLFH